MAPGRRKSASAGAPAGPRKAWNVGDLVLAKVKGYPAWPAKVSTPEKHKMSPKSSKVFVEYFGTNDLGFVQRKEVSEFTPAARAIIVEKAKSAHKSFKAAVKGICDYVDSFKEKLIDGGKAAKELAEAVSSEDHQSGSGTDSPARNVDGGDSMGVVSRDSEAGPAAAVSSGGDTTDRGEVVDEQEFGRKHEETADGNSAKPLGEEERLDPLNSFASAACLVLDKLTAEADNSRCLSVEDNAKTVSEQIEKAEDAVDKDEKMETRQGFEAARDRIHEEVDERERFEAERENATEKLDEREGSEAKAEKENVTRELDGGERFGAETENVTAGNENLDDREGVGLNNPESEPDAGVSPLAIVVEAKILKTYERRKRAVKSGEKSEKKQDGGKEYKDDKGQPSGESLKAHTKLDTKNTEKLEKKLLKKSKADVSDGKNSKNEKLRRTDSDATKKRKVDSEDDVKRRDKHRDRKDETLPPSKRQKFLRVDREDFDSLDKRVKGERESQTKAVQTTKKTVTVVAKELPELSPVSAAAPPKLFEEDTNKVRAAYEAAKEMKQRLALKDETSSASMKFLKAAAQAKQRIQTSSTTSNRESPLFMRPNSDKYHKASPSQRRSSGEKHIQLRTKGVDKLETFRGMLETLTRSKESISKATRFAMECANKGLGKKVMDVIMRKLKNERDHKKRVDVLFLVDSLTQYYHQKGTSGRGYAHIVEACLVRFLSAVAPPNSPSENRQQCVKVVSLWLKRDIMQESLLKDTMAKLEAGLNTTQRQYQRQDRAIDDPLRGLDDMLVDEYGSNTSFQLPGLLVRQVDEDDDLRRDRGARAPVVMEDVDGELEMEDVSPRAENHSRDDNNSSSSSLTRHEDGQEDYNRGPLPPSSPPPPLPPPPPPSPPFHL
ncbi:ENHANCER OF AG-4 protein 2-like [Selaginella moellendorffii]|uniref:ENHANCER OF AG-4 protein 2-like n=1 Tax=Selaginella moellendorffii TaxID=88036 RepID=UPI000D1CE9A7|nr:ENHANCER OF AG-4 protein 2-like [Selaginella moellendorffii]|eukprot:XP_024539770.1 ENHANCER OF AG-4 protein 2-like [Selaginella moellendorffii]